jgi:licheninase
MSQTKGAFIGLLVLAAVVLAPAVAGAQTWTLVWSDEFNYTGYPDAAKWRPEVWNPGVVNQELQYYTANLDNASVANGVLTIKAAAVWNASRGANDYYSARLNSRASWTYGRFEARMRLPGGWGTWPAFWLYPDNDFYYGTNPITNYGWPNCGEMDIMEEVGYDQNRIHASTHSACCFWGNGTQRSNTIVVSDPTVNWHVYAAEWTANKIDFFVDGTRFFTVNNDGTGWQSWPFNHNFHIILNLAVGGVWGGAQGVDPNIWPRSMQVDYVRVYRQAAATPRPTARPRATATARPGARATATPTSSGGQTIANGTYRIIARHSGKALDVAGNGTADGTNVHQWTYGGGNNQRWNVTHLGSGQYQIQSVSAGKALDAAAAGTANGTNVHIWTYGGGNNQRWTIASLGSGYYRVSPVHAPALALDVSGPSTADGANVHLWTYGGGTNQQWQFLAP